MIVEKEYAFDELEIDLSIIEKCMGYPDGQCPEPITEVIQQAMLEAEKTCKAKAMFLVQDEVVMDMDAKKIKIGSEQFNPGMKVVNLLKRSEKMVLYVCTIGDELENLSKKEMAEGDVMKGYAMDVIASNLVEAASESMQSEVEKIAQGQGLKITNRYSPGYCEWSVSEQQQLFSFFPDKPLGIELSESSLMHPIKSVSGIIGLGQNVKYNKYTCDICNSQNCIYKNVRKSF